MEMDWVSFLTDPVTLASAFAALATFATVVTLAAPAFSGDKLATRLKAVSNRREELRKKSRAALDGDAKKSIRVQDTSTLKKFVDKLDLAKMLEDPGVLKKLAQAGLRGPKPISIFYFARFSMPIVFGILAFIYIWFINDHGLQMQMKLGVVVGGIVMAMFLPIFQLGAVAGGM